MYNFNINLPQAENMPFNVFHKTIYLIYNLNNLRLLSLSLLKKKFNHCHVNVIHMHIIAFCIHFSIIACCPYITCSSVCNYNHILCVLVTQCFVPICIKHHSCICLGISLFDSKHLYNNVLFLTCSISYFVFIYGKLNKISISISISKTGSSYFLPPCTNKICGFKFPLTFTFFGQ